jgi:hypothetical protein
MINKWLDVDMKSNRLPDLEPTSVEGGLQRYDIEIKTGNDFGAGTDEQIELVMNGNEGSVNLDLLAKDAITTNKDLFEKGQVDSFVVYRKPVGALIKIVIGHDGKGVGADWQLEYAKIAFNKETYRCEFLIYFIFYLLITCRFCYS